MTSPATVHLINHTHWDREWFLTSVYTSRWIPGLIEKLEQIVADNTDYRYYLDGQTLVVEDLLQIAPEYEAKTAALVARGNLIIGPYYCQPDWKLTCGEAMLRNLALGRVDCIKYASENHTGWLVDTFGHISQAPQIHRLFEIDAVYVWRGVPSLEPYFHWQGPNGEQLFTINLFGGYRNLYGVTHVPEIAVDRLQAEVRKLAPYYPTADIPLFDGYDLEDNPEDPLSFYKRRSAELPPDLHLVESSPQEFAEFIRQKLEDLPMVQGELNSGKYAATFPGTLSARTYLKIMSRDCEQLLYQVCEPLGVLARSQGRAYQSELYESWSRALLQNAVHDCICGVSIDQVHEKMEYSYRQVFDEMLADIQHSLAYILRDFAPGAYAVSTNPYPYSGWQVIRDRLYFVKADGVGVWPVKESIPIENPNKAVEHFSWQNEHYKAVLQEDGTLLVGDAVLGELAVYREQGDAYSNEGGELIGVCPPQKPFIIESKSDLHCVLRVPFAGSWDDVRITAVLQLIFDASPLICWRVHLDTRGTGFRVDIGFTRESKIERINAGMPFDVVERPTADRDLLPRQLDNQLSGVLLGQRELGIVTTFPFQEYISLSDGTSSMTILAKGLHAYHVDESGEVAITLRRAIEWLTRPELNNRVGDAGPFFYVPDARCERSVTHELAVMITDFGVDDPRFGSLNAGFQNSPLIVESAGKGERTQWQFLREDLPLSSLQIDNNQVLARFFNPTLVSLPLSRPFAETDILGNPEKSITAVPPKAIITVALDEPLPEILPSQVQTITPINTPAWRVGPNMGRPDPKIVQLLKDKISRLERQIAAKTRALDMAIGRERYIHQHQIYILERELFECRLSVRLNELKLAAQGKLSYDYLYNLDEEIAEIGLQLNRLRIKRRIYDYVIQGD
jgi:alpha-mannosidase